MRKKTKLICGVGVNDADYTIQEMETAICNNGKRKQKLIWICPFYRTWTNMLVRVYSDKFLEKYPTYAGCSVVNGWITFSNFRRWMIIQDWQDNQLDKDIIAPGNKIYGPDTCAFVSARVNVFITERGNDRGEWPLGVHWHKRDKKFISRCSNPFTGEREFLGCFTCPSQAHLAWKARKYELALLLADEQTDTRVAEALRIRYV